MAEGKKTRKAKTIKVWFKEKVKDAIWEEYDTAVPLATPEEAIAMVKTFPIGTEYRIFTVLKFGTVSEVVTKKVTI